MPSWKCQTFVVLNSDNLYSVNALRLLLNDQHASAMIDYDRAALKFKQSRIEQFSVIRKDSDGFLLDIIEKPSLQQIEMAKDINGRIGISMNIFKLSYDMIFPFLEKIPLHPVRQEKELPMAIKMLVDRYPQSMITIPLAEHVVDLTNQNDIPYVMEYLKKEFPK